MSSFDLDSYLQTQQERVDHLLRARSDEMGVHVPPRLLESMRYSLLAGGKRLRPVLCLAFAEAVDRKSTRLNSSHANISYAVFCLKKTNTSHKYGPALH